MTAPRTTPKRHCDRIQARSNIFTRRTGLANARNRGLELAKGSYLALCDGDDIWLPNKLELQHACFEVHNRLGMVFSDFSSFNDAGPLAPSWSKKYFNTIFENYGLTLDSIFQKKINLHDLNTLYAGNITTTMFLGNIVMPSTVMIKRECINSVGKFREKYKNDSDTTCSCGSPRNTKADIWIYR
jgi:glycosyltransferase involved in cell wall biosynthesis